MRKEIVAIWTNTGRAGRAGQLPEGFSLAARQTRVNNARQSVNKINRPVSENVNTTRRGGGGGGESFAPAPPADKPYSRAYSGSPLPLPPVLPPPLVCQILRASRRSRVPAGERTPRRIIHFLKRPSASSRRTRSPRLGRSLCNVCILYANRRRPLVILHNKIIRPSRKYTKRPPVGPKNYCYNV